MNLTYILIGLIAFIIGLVLITKLSSRSAIKIAENKAELFRFRRSILPGDIVKINRERVYVAGITYYNVIILDKETGDLVHVPLNNVFPLYKS